MALTRRSFLASSNATIDTLPVNAPAGLADNDEVVISGGFDNGSGSSNPAISTFTEIRTTDDGSSVQSLFYKIAASEGASWNMTGGGGTGPAIAHAWALNPSGGTTSVDATSIANADSTTLATGAVVVVSGGILLASYTHDGGDTVGTPPSGMTLESLTTAGSYSMVSYYEFPSAGSQSRTIVWANTEQLIAVAFTATATGGGGGGSYRAFYGDSPKYSDQ